MAACFSPPLYLGSGILFPFSHNLESAPSSPLTLGAVTDSKLNKNLRPVAAGGCWLRLAPSLINWHSHCLLSEYTNFLFVQRFRSVLVGNFIFLCCAVIPPRLYSAVWLGRLHPLFNAEEIDDLGEKIFSIETKTLVMRDWTKNIRHSSREH